MRHKAALVLLISLLLLVALGLGVAIVYSDYIYNPNGNLSTLQIGLQNDTGYVDSLASGKEKAFLLDLEQWAREHHATILFKDGFTAGVGYCCYSDWGRDNLRVTMLRNETPGIYVEDSPHIRTPYEKDGIFLPESAGLEIAGYYSPSPLPMTLQGVDFLYPIAFAAETRGMYFTDTDQLDDLVHFFQRNGFQVLSRRDHSTPSVTDLVKGMLADGPLALATLAAMAGLVFCFVYGILTLYQDLTRTWRIHHLFGMSRRRLALGISGVSLAVLTGAVLLFRMLLLKGLTYLAPVDLRRICGFAVLLYVGLVVFVTLVGWVRLSPQLDRKGGI